MTEARKEIVRRWFAAIADTNAAPAAAELLGTPFNCHDPASTWAADPASAADLRRVLETVTPGIPPPGGRQTCMIAEREIVAVLGADHTADGRQSSA